jgi:hypothetical protein
MLRNHSPQHTAVGPGRSPYLRGSPAISLVVFFQTFAAATKTGEWLQRHCKLRQRGRTGLLLKGPPLTPMGRAYIAV